MTSWCTPRVTISRETGFGFMNLMSAVPGDVTPRRFAAPRAPPECPLIDSLRSLCESPDTPSQTPPNDVSVGESLTLTLIS